MKYSMCRMSRIGTIKELFSHFLVERKFYMFPIIILLLAMIGVTTLSQTGIITLIYPI